jgi:hypothetical protein
VEWRFAPSAADVARTFIFHPDQQVQDEADGSLTVRFTAGGWLEMAWHLYQWGDVVEVIAPPKCAASSRPTVAAISLPCPDTGTRCPVPRRPVGVNDAVEIRLHRCQPRSSGVIWHR